MLSSLSGFEIVELADGEVGLCKAGEEGEPLVTIKFSKDADEHIQDFKLEVVKAMIEAGMEVVTEALESGADLDPDQARQELDVESRILH